MIKDKSEGEPMQYWLMHVERKMKAANNDPGHDMTQAAARRSNEFLERQGSAYRWLSKTEIEAL